MNRYQLADSLIGVLEEPLAGLGLDLLDVRVFQGGGRLTLRVYVDTADGITVDDCARASRTVGMLLEETDLLADAYLIEVTSPGVRRPLRTDAHYRAAVGQDIVLKMAADGGSRTLKGKLRASGTGTIVLETPAADAPADGVAGVETLELRLDAIREANLDPEFDVQALINADRRRRKQEKKQARQQRREQKRRPREG